MPKQLEFTWEQAPEPSDSTPLASSRAIPREGVTPLPSRREIETAARELHHDLTERTGLTIRLRISNNSSTMLSVRHNQAGTVASLSVHYMFLSAAPNVKRALASWVKRPKARKSGSVLDAFIREHSHQIHPSKRRGAPLHTAGHHHDLEALFDELNEKHFNGAIGARITWGRMPALRRRRSIRFGSHCSLQNLIRIHPLLDQAFVPRYLVRYIIFHEMLHAFLGVDEKASGRRSIHPARFTRLEKAYPDYERAVAWIEDVHNLNRLLHPRKHRASR